MDAIKILAIVLIATGVLAPSSCLPMARRASL